MYDYILYERNYKTTVWILAGNGINFFHSSGLNYATYTRRQINSCVTKASACHHTLQANHWHRLWEILGIIGVKNNIRNFNYVCKLIVNMFYCGRILTVLSMPISKAWCTASRAQRPITTGIVRRQFPSLSGTTWRNSGSSARNGSRFEHHIRFYSG